MMTRSGEPIIRNARINQSVCQWCYRNMSVEELAQSASRIGIKGIDLVGPEHFATLEKHGLIVLRNEAHPIRANGATTPLMIIGLDDEWSGHIDPEEAWSGIDPSLPIICDLR